MSYLLLLSFGLAAGAALSYVWHRLSRQPAPHPPRPVSDRRLAQLHVIDTEYGTVHIKEPNT